MPGSQRCLCSSVPPRRISSPAISERVPSEPRPRNGQAEHAECRQLLDNRDGDQLVAQVPAVGGLRVRVSEAAHLPGHHGQGLIVQARIAEVLLLRKARGESLAQDRAGQVHELARRAGLKARIDTQICGPDRLPLADSDAAGQLAQVLLEAQRQDQSFALAQLALCLQARRPGPELFQRRARRRRPGQTVDRKLLIAQARPGDGLRDAGARRGLIVLNRGEGGGRALEERAGIIEPVGQTCGWGDGHGA